MFVTPLVRSLVSLISLLTLSLAFVLLPATAASAAGEEGDFFARLNALRTSVGLAPLTAVGDLASIARAHSQRMSDQNLLYHNPSLTTQVTNWLSVGENVGYGGSVAAVHDALANSAPHRANMLNGTYTEVGIGTVVSPSGRLWVTQVFRKPVIATRPAPLGFPISSLLAPTVSAFSGTLGAPINSEYAVPGGIEQDFRGGDVLWGPSTNARVVQGAIRDRYRALAGARSPLGLPATHELATPAGSGRYNHFQNGSIYWSPSTGAREIRGAIRGTWGRLGWENSALGFPLTDELATPNGIGRYNHFQGGSIYWTPAIGAKEVRGAIRGTWASLGWENSALGFPVTDELPTPDRLGRYNHFQTGSIYWTPGTGAREVRGSIRQRWAATGWELGSLGYPTSNEYAIAGGRRNDFQRGSIVWDARTGLTNIV